MFSFLLKIIINYINHSHKLTYDAFLLKYIIKFEFVFLCMKNALIKLVNYIHKWISMKKNCIGRIRWNYVSCNDLN